MHILVSAATASDLAETAEQSIDYRLSTNLYKRRAAIKLIAALCRMGFLFMNFYPLCRGFSCIALLCGFYDGFGKLLES